MNCRQCLMQHKSYLIENNIGNLKENLVLFYGENLGLKNDFKKKIRILNKDQYEIVNLTQDEVLNNNSFLFTEVTNISLFEKKKIFLIDQANDKILNIIEELKPKLEEHKIYLFSELLDKKSKLRNSFEESNETGVVPCYQDNEITLKKIILNELKDYEGLTTININLILDNSVMDRSKLNNELEKIKLYFNNKKIETEKLDILLNDKVYDDFNILKDEAFIGNRIKTNSLLSETNFEESKILFYLNIINVRLNKIYEVVTNKNKKLEDCINSLRPPIFWKDKPNFLKQTKIWSTVKLREMMKRTYKLEMQLKSNTIIEKKILIKKLLIDICNMANS